MTDTNIISESGDYFSSDYIKLLKDEEEIVFHQKKSILVIRNRESDGSVFRRATVGSKGNIQWSEQVKQKLTEEDNKWSKTGLLALDLLTTKGSRWHHIHEIVQEIKTEEEKLCTEPLETQKIIPLRSDHLAHDLGYGVSRRRPDLGKIELTLDQSSKLHSLKIKVKAQNDCYLKQHSELEILLLLIYSALFKSQPDDPKLFVADYVHFLNTHKTNLEYERDAIVPFDPPPHLLISLETSTDHQREEVELFARSLIEKCASLAAHGPSYVNIMSIINSLLIAVSPSEEDVLEGYPKNTAANVASEIITSLFNSVAIAGSKSSELVVDEILDIIVGNIQPSIEEDSGIYVDMKKSVDRFVQSLVKTLKNRVSGEIKRREMVGSSFPTNNNGNLSNYLIDKNDLSSMTGSILNKNGQPSNSILKETLDLLSTESSESSIETLRPESSVKFQQKPDSI